jgi:hypothetical protein
MRSRRRALPSCPLGAGCNRRCSIEKAIMALASHLERLSFSRGVPITRSSGAPPTLRTYVLFFRYFAWPSRPLADGHRRQGPQRHGSHNRPADAPGRVRDPLLHTRAAREHALSQTNPDQAEPVPSRSHTNGRSRSSTRGRKRRSSLPFAGRRVKEDHASQAPGHLDTGHAAVELCAARSLEHSSSALRFQARPAPRRHGRQHRCSSASA